MREGEEKTPVSEEHLDELVDNVVEKVIQESLPTVYGQDYDVACRVYKAFFRKEHIEKWALLINGHASPEGGERYWMRERHNQIMEFLPKLFEGNKTKSYYRPLPEIK
jgi:hypothetical protein